MSKEMEDKMRKVMAGPPGDFQKLWKLMEESNAGTMEMKLFKEEGDKKPFRAIILVNGVRETQEILELIEVWKKE